MTSTNGGLFDLSGRVALITGGNGGLGLGMALGLAEAGCDTLDQGNGLTTKIAVKMA